MSALLSTPVMTTRALYHHLNPVPHHRTHHHVEDGGGQWVPLCHPPESLECLPVVSSQSHDHLQTTPVRTEDPESLIPHTISLQDFQASIPVQGVIRLVQAHKYHVQDLLLQGR